MYYKMGEMSEEEFEKILAENELLNHLVKSYATLYKIIRLVSQNPSIDIAPYLECLNNLSK